MKGSTPDLVLLMERMILWLERITALTQERKGSHFWLLVQDQALSSSHCLRSQLLAVITASIPLASCFTLQFEAVFKAGHGPAGDSLQLCPCARDTLHLLQVSHYPSAG